ncbi:MAG: hypothetical protein ACM31L_01895 [Actinomycetota bacterium]
MRIAVVLAAVGIALATPALAEKPATPQADAMIAGQSTDAQKIAAEVQGGISDWKAFCAKPNDAFAGSAKEAAMALKGRKALGGYGTSEIQAVIKYFSIGCQETGARN